jgi:SAM-dependent methyltransferase
VSIYHDHYQEYYQDEDPEWRLLCAREKAQNIISLCDSIKHVRVLEIGAGDGAITQLLCQAQFSASHHALEISTSGVEALKSRALPAHVEVDLFDGVTVPFEDNHFDVVILSHVVEHLEHPRQLIGEARRLAPHLFIEVPLEDTLRLPLDYRPNAVGHINFYTPSSIRRLIQTCGFKVIKQRVAPPSLKAHHYSSGARGVLSYALKKCALKLNQRYAPALFTYHASLLCERSEDASPLSE